MDYSELVSKIKGSIAFIFCVRAEGTNGTGTGFIFYKKNILVTCEHVVKDASSIVVKFPGETDFREAQVILRDIEHDLALLSIENDTREPLAPGFPCDVKEGMPILFSGYPLRIQTLTTHRGMLSGIAQDPTGTTTYLIDGTVNAGNSGCPLLNDQGQVIGVINAKRMERAELLKKVKQMQSGALSLHGTDLVELFKALIDNVQLGIGYAVPAAYIPEHKAPESALPSLETSNEVSIAQGNEPLNQ